MISEVEEQGEKNEQMVKKKMDMRKFMLKLDYECLKVKRRNLRRKEQENCN